MKGIREFSQSHNITKPEDTIELLKTIGKMIGEMFGKRCEIAISDLDDPQRKLLWIFNGEVTNRSAGSVMNKDAYERLLAINKSYHLNYAKVVDEKDKEIKASSLILAVNGHQYSFCINYDVTLEKQNFYRLQSFLSMQPEEVTNHTVSDPNADEIREIVNNEVIRLGKAPYDLKKDERISIVHELYHLGLFKRQRSVPIVSEILGVSRYTIYNDINYLKKRHDHK